MAAPTVYKVTATTVFLMGFVLHLTNVVIGPDRLVPNVFSPKVEIAFAVMMIVAAVSGWMSLKRLTSRGALRVVYWVALLLITLSIPIHVRSVVLWTTAWVHSFPKYYSHVETPMFLALAYLVNRFRFS
jgi:Ni/Fe-hydrogenase subunit HybB-like protein